MSKSDNPFRYFNSSPEVIRLVVMLYVRFSLSLRNVEDLLFERGIDMPGRIDRTGAAKDVGKRHLLPVILTVWTKAILNREPSCWATSISLPVIRRHIP